MKTFSSYQLALCAIIIWGGGFPSLAAEEGSEPVKIGPVEPPRVDIDGIGTPVAKREDFDRACRAHAFEQFNPKLKHEIRILDREIRRPAAGLIVGVIRGPRERFQRLSSQLEMLAMKLRSTASRLRILTPDSAENFEKLSGRIRDPLLKDIRELQRDLAKADKCKARSSREDWGAWHRGFSGECHRKAEKALKRADELAQNINGLKLEHEIAAAPAIAFLNGIIANPETPAGKRAQAREALGALRRSQENFASVARDTDWVWNILRKNERREILALDKKLHRRVEALERLSRSIEDAGGGKLREMASAIHALKETEKLWRSLLEGPEATKPSRLIRGSDAIGAAIEDLRETLRRSRDAEEKCQMGLQAEKKAATTGGTVGPDQPLKAPGTKGL